MFLSLPVFYFRFSCSDLPQSNYAAFYSYPPPNSRNTTPVEIQ